MEVTYVRAIACSKPVILLANGRPTLNTAFGFQLGERRQISKVTQAEVLQEGRGRRKRRWSSRAISWR
jgi:hypothetical protein